MSEASVTRTLESLGQIVLNDLDLGLRFSGKAHTPPDDVAGSVMALAEKMPIAYTAFDGDHFHLCSHMRAYVLAHGLVPANPESILGYKETVSHRLNKPGVLLDDLAVLRGCSELWVFTECEPHPPALRVLAEGVVVELLYYLKRRDRARVRFVSTIGVMAGRDTAPRNYSHGYVASKAALGPDQDAILSLANSGGKVDAKIPSLLFHISDPLDFKYAHWLRDGGYAAGQAPLVPGLAIGLRDAGASLSGLGTALVAWARLASLAQVAVELPSLDAGRTPSAIAHILRQVWLRLHGGTGLRHEDWRDYSIPKANMGARWPITRKEGGL